ncbi:PilY2 family type 4a fimbrial biogenesis protein [Metapseudomonas otitidis]|uniref:PilY2 family type 4a fimbrial biogenesis protein n=1 Tax=Metapseudomonas otitidis TaxID=319939 RepID=UPI001F330731|nr:PilY2 family type 4a fimbrial biogenesis protein [Pseudomonas otitidis]
MEKLYRFFLTLGFFTFSHCVFAATFEDGGVVESVDLARNTVVVDGATYHLANSVKESSQPSGLPAIMLLREGMYVFFYGEDASAKRIDSISIHSQGAVTSTGGERGADER